MTLASSCPWLQPFLVLLLVSFIYLVYVCLLLLPALQHIHESNVLLTEGSEASLLPSSVPLFHSLLSDAHSITLSFSEFILTSLGFHVLFLLFVASYVKAIVTAPGSVPVERIDDKKKWDDGLFDISPADDARIEALISDPSRAHELEEPEVQDFIRSMILVERKKEAHAHASPINGHHGHGHHSQQHGLKRHCKTCQIFKPDRTHHCKVCDHCVLRMDHHCPWVANCIGFRNYKYFLLILFYAECLCLWILWSLWPRFVKCFDPFIDRKQLWYFDVPVGVVWGLCLVLGVGVGLFLAFHVWMVLNALTSIERSEKRSSADPAVQHRWKIAHIKYDLGWKENFLHIMGPSPSWLFPVDANPLDDGTYSHPPMYLGDIEKKQ